MPGACGGGGGKPPMVTCPRCHRETRDTVSETIALATIFSGIGSTVLLSFGAASLSRWCEGLAAAVEHALEATAPLWLVVPIVGLVLIYRFVVRCAVKHHVEYACTHCQFRWRFESCFAEDLVEPTRELDSELWHAGFARIHRPNETRYERGGRERTLAVVLSPDSLRLGATLAHPETLTPGQRAHIEERLQALADAVAPRLERTIVRSVSLGDGEVRATVGPWSAHELPELLRRLESVAAELGLVATIRVASERHDHARCAVCHEDLADPTDEAAVACPRCATVVHRECWSELGRCPVLGCRGTLASARPLAA